MRSVNSLKKENIITLGDLVQRTEEQMLNIENFGIKSLEEIRQFLNEHNLHFGMKLEEGEDGDLYLLSSGTASPREQPADRSRSDGRSARGVGKMRHCVKRDASFDRTAEHRKAMMRNMATSLFLHGRVETTTRRRRSCAVSPSR